MAILSKVIENKRDEYMIQVLEEGTTELESLKTKKYLTENLTLIGKILMEEGVVDAAKANLANNWGKYAAGAGVVGAGAAAIANPEMAGNLVDAAQNPMQAKAEGLDMVDPTVAGLNTQEALQSAQDKIHGYYDNVKQMFVPTQAPIDPNTPNLDNNGSAADVKGPDLSKLNGPIPGM